MEISSPDQFKEQAVASRPCQISPALFHPPHAAFRASFSLPITQIPAFLFCQPLPQPAVVRKGGQAHPQCQQFHSTPGTARTRNRRTGGRQSGEPRELLSHTSSTEPAGSPWMRVDGKDTDSWGPAFPVTALSALSWAKVRVPVLVGTALPPPPSPAQRAGSAQAALCKTSRS